MVSAIAAMESARCHQYICCRTSIQKHSCISAFAATYHGICSVPVLEQYPNSELQDNEMWGKRMNHDGFNACACLLQACGSFTQLLKLHTHIVINGLQHNIVLGAKLVTMYAKFGDLGDARKVFNKMPERNVFLWNAMIRGYAGKGFWQQTLELYFEMRASGTEADYLTFPVVIRACAVLSALQKGKEIHCHVGRGGFESDIYVGNALIDMYAKCGSVSDARQVFDKMLHRDVISWTAMIGGYSQNGQASDALFLFDLMQRSDVQPNAVTFVNVLPACADLGFLQKGEHLHNHIIESGFGFDISVGTALIDMYAKCGSIEKARRVFDKMHERNIIMWTAMITGYIRNGCGEMALNLFHQMLMTNLKPDSVTIVNVLSACINSGNLNHGKWIHEYVIQNGLELDVSIENSLVAMYAGCGNLQVARELFDKLSQKTVMSWNAMIAGYAENRHFKEVMALFSQMKLTDVKPNSITMVSLLSACSVLGDLQLGMWIHNYIIRNGFESNVFVGTAVTDMYCKCGGIELARVVFDTMCEKNVVSWSAMIAGYAQNGLANEAFTLFQEMQFADITPNPITFIGLLPACADLQDLGQGRSIHGYIIRSGFDSNVSVQTALLDMYAKCRDIEAAGQLFDNISTRDVVSWNAMIAGYAQNIHATKALTLFHEMKLANVQPDSVSMTCVLPACAHLAALEQGKWIHTNIIRSGFDSEISVVTALIDMYTKCGALYFACKLFDKMVEKDVVSWNTMIGAYGMHGYSKEALELFSKMRSMCVKPDQITFVCVLSTCSHAGLVDEGWQNFKCMLQDYCIKPSMEHYACMVDLLGRAGQLDEAHIFIQNMPLEPDAGIWGALLGACKIYCNIQLGELVAERLFQLEPDNAGHYVLLSNIYAAVSRWDDMAKVRRKMKGKRLQKTPGYSSIEVNYRVHVFLVED
ncbi:pentatricopeptide repeat-containing protein At2g39620 [Cryptomeria japonica]|uniref:pentatricopeptide repeat-containing protein At2g39620 n=1 Tax=Cryptomeria japonica TaxID=3369 RepID=UPI0027DA7BCB|nr:pentatricopeptide repeat-containing protein At2g39620 [Cryptomeria japonica]